MEEIGSRPAASPWSTVLNESLVLSVVKDDSSELVKRDQSLEVASEKSMLIESAYLSSLGRIIPSLG